MAEPTPPGTSLRPQDVQNAPVHEKRAYFLDRLKDQNDRLAAMLGSKQKAARLREVAITALNENPSLYECEWRSVLQGIVLSMRFGLELGALTGHCFLIPRQSKNHGMKVANFQLGYKGLLAMAYRSPQIKAVHADVIYPADEWDYQQGTDAFLNHKPSLDPSRKFDGENAVPIVGAWASVDLQGGGSTFVIMSRADIEHVRTRSKARAGSPWFSDFDEMAKKTAIIRVLKTSPLSTELQDAATLDELSVAGKQDLSGMYQAEAEGSQAVVHPDGSEDDPHVSAVSDQPQPQPQQESQSTDDPFGDVPV